MGYLITFALTRLYTRSARKHGWGSGSVGGAHMHHMVPGVILMVVGGILGFTQYGYIEIVYGIAAILFGAGLALTLDEFAMILHLEDVYWTNEGPTSIDATIMGVAASGLLLVSSSPVGEGGSWGTAEEPSSSSWARSAWRSACSSLSRSTSCSPRSPS